MYSNFLELLKERNLKSSDVARATGISNATFSDWKHGRSVPKFDKLVKIADFFSVPVEYFLDGSESGDLPLTSKEVLLLDLFRGLNRIGQDRILEYIDDLSRSGKYQKKTPGSSRSVG